jgi:hypothetical protein
MSIVKHLHLYIYSLVSSVISKNIVAAYLCSYNTTE